jgi:hypothetical protein
VSSGPEHYRTAERLLDDVARGAMDIPEAQAVATLALAHATLAQAAATVSTANRSVGSDWLPSTGQP